MGTTSVSRTNAPGGVPKREPRPIYLRAYAEPAIVKAPSIRREEIHPTGVVIVFDCETTVDETQQLRFGSYQVRINGLLREKGLFYDPDNVDDDELSALQHDRAADLNLRTVRSFVEEIFYDIGYRADAVFVGFNLPFDISRLAIGHQSAKRVRRKDGSVDRSMVGGFTFKLSNNPDRPNVRVKHLSRKAAFINFAAPDENPDGARISRGYFLDLKTLAGALTSRSFTLDRLAEFLDLPGKTPFRDFARKIDREYIEYAAQDSEVTWLCHQALIKRFNVHDLRPTEATQIYSEASLGKAYLKAMGIKPWLAVEKSYSARTIGRIMSAYFGGRAEVHRRREVVRTLYCDFASMYPTVCTLMGLWRFVIADGIEEHDATAEARAVLANLTSDQLGDQDFWKNLRVLVEVKPDADIFPIRARYGEGPSHTIGVNYLSAERTLWFTLADCIASTLLAGKPPHVVSATRFEAKSVQKGLSGVTVAGTGQAVDPVTDDFYRRVINIRRTVKAELKADKARGKSKIDIDRLDAEQLALKILANATSYGVFIELNVEDADDDGEDVRVHGADPAFPAEPGKIERPGIYFHPLLATLITGAARLMLAITECLALDAGLDWAFCDTDSMAFAMPAGMDADVFRERVEGVCQWFEGLNPYEEKGSILEMEDQNFATTDAPDGTKVVAKGPDGKPVHMPIYCFAVSAKRYALFNREPGGDIIIRKASAHGLGHLLAPYHEEDPDAPHRESGVMLWQEDVWRAIIGAAMAGHPRRVSFDWHESLTTHAASQHTASTPDLLRIFRHYNAGRTYPSLVRPFNFMLWFFAKRPADRVWDDPAGAVPWNPRERPPKAASPYHSDPRDVPDDEIFDRDTGEPVAKSDLRSYAEVMRGYHRSPETKFLGGGSHDIGPLRRRHVAVGPIYYIGKEADSFEETEEYGEDEDNVTLYGAPPPDRSAMVELIAAVPVRKLKPRAKVGHALIGRAARNDATVSDRLLLKVYRAALVIVEEERQADEDDAALYVWVKDWVDAHTIAELARSLPHDPSNLAAALSGRRLGKALAAKVRRFKAGLEE